MDPSKLYPEDLEDIPGSGPISVDNTNIISHHGSHIPHLHDELSKFRLSFEKTVSALKYYILLVE